MTGKYPDLSFKDLKNLAKLRAKKKGIKLSVAQQEVAREAGFRDLDHAKRVLSKLDAAVGPGNPRGTFQVDTASVLRETSRLDAEAAQRQRGLIAALLYQFPASFFGLEEIATAFWRYLESEARRVEKNDQVDAALALIRPAKSPGQILHEMFPAGPADDRAWVVRMFRIASGEIDWRDVLAETPSVEPDRSGKQRHQKKRRHRRFGKSPPFPG